MTAEKTKKNTGKQSTQEGKKKKTLTHIQKWKTEHKQVRNWNSAYRPTYNLFNTSESIPRTIFCLKT